METEASQRNENDDMPIFDFDAAWNEASVEVATTRVDVNKLRAAVNHCVCKYTNEIERVRQECEKRGDEIVNLKARLAMTEKRANNASRFWGERFQCIFYAFVDLKNSWVWKIILFLAPSLAQKIVAAANESLADHPRPRHAQGESGALPEPLQNI